MYPVVLCLRGVAQWLDEYSYCVITDSFTLNCYNKKANLSVIQLTKRRKIVLEQNRSFHTALTLEQSVLINLIIL